MESQSCFNTSHVTLYLLQTTQILHMEEVSIHHMLLFITFREHTLHGCSFVSIHHMLLFICSRQDSGENVPGFQYITCYSLSKKRVRKNTGRILFQYITCYSLSFRWELHSVTVFLFQYITCYSLSVIGLVTVHTCERFNTSHVTLYPIDPKKLDNTDFSFNTSHVTLYRKQIFTLFCKINRFNTSHVTLYQRVTVGK